MSTPDACDADDGCPCHGWPVVVWVTGVPTQEAAETLVEALLAATPDVAVVRG
jgi:hypothetical protein